MAKEIPAFLWAEIGDDATDLAHEARNCVLGRLAQMRLEFAEGEFDRVEVRRILRKINERRARRFDRLLDAGDLVNRQMIHEHGIAALEWWNKALFNVSEKHRPVHCSRKHERRHHRALPQSG